MTSDPSKFGTNSHHTWQEEFHIYGMVTTIEDHKLPQAEIDEETYVGFDVPPEECEACQKEYYNRPKYAVKGWDYDTAPVSLEGVTWI